ncbi:unnamed protein product [Rotaria socialis]|uniref:Geranylgeranyl transferase type II subunit beta n=2 Tax=Rotaria socialis TaxID=392032 RepID=A0A820PVF8_9BILA|nr:unnamed protein product [Rotaria socialis]CAF4412299.1 unnamed protein product [Rotaria socialis]CAF4477007.1 unnamed protein product [Rotaria socialis]CAF4628222.1 unnamed protein product [Rotaria socialis]
MKFMFLLVNVTSIDSDFHAKFADDSFLNLEHCQTREKLSKFILASQDDETGGCFDRPGNISDPFHTLLGMAGLSLLNIYNENIIREVNPVLFMPEYVIQKLEIKMQLL